MKLDLQYLKTITILYVEDELNIRENITKTFEMLFKKVYVAQDGQIGLDIFNKHQEDIEIVVSDINMPNKNGMEMIKDILAIKQVPIIITTAHNDKDYLQQAIELNIKKYINKPLKTKELVNDIANVVKENRKENHIKKATISLAMKSQDINDEKKELEIQIDKNNKELTLLRALSDKYISIIHTDKNAIITEVSTKFCNLYGYTKDEIIGEKITKIQDEKHNDSEIQKHMLEAIHKKISISAVHNFRTKDGKLLECNMIMNPHFGDDSYIDGYTFYQDLIHI